MSKRYVVTEESGCGCGSLVVGAIFLSIIYPYVPYLVGIIVIIAIIWLIIYIPKYNKKKKRQMEEDELAEREHQLILEQRRMDLEVREREMRNKRNRLNGDRDSSWDDF